MKAYARTAVDRGEVKLVEVPVPQIAHDEVLVQVQAFGIGIHNRSLIPQRPTFPSNIGTEGAGTVAEIGGQVTDVAVGDRVISTPMQPHVGTLCTFKVLLRAYGLDNPGLSASADLVHEPDLQDGRGVCPETPGLDALYGAKLPDPALEAVAFLESPHRALTLEVSHDPAC